MGSKCGINSSSLGKGRGRQFPPPHPYARYGTNEDCDIDTYINYGQAAVTDSKVIQQAAVVWYA